MPPTDSSVFIRNLRALYGYTETTLYLIYGRAAKALRSIATDEWVVTLKMSCNNREMVH